MKVIQSSLIRNPQVMRHCICISMVIENINLQIKVRDKMQLHAVWEVLVRNPLCTLVPLRYNYSTGMWLRDPYTGSNVHYIVRAMARSLSAPSPSVPTQQAY